MKYEREIPPLVISRATANGEAGKKMAGETERCYFRT